MTLLDLIDSLRETAVEEASGDATAHTRLLQHLHVLIHVAESPAEKTMRMRFQMLQNLCIRMALECGVLQAIAVKRGERVNAASLSKQTGAEELFIIRIMRLVTYVDVCNEVGYGEYSANDTTAFITQKALIGGEKHHTDLTFPIGGKLVEMMRGPGLHQFPESGQKNPFEYTFGKPLFEYFAQDPEQKQAFDDYMSERRSASQPQWFDIYPAEQELLSSHSQPDSRDTALVVDMGGGNGHELAKFGQRFPDHTGRLIVQDLPETFAKLSNLSPVPNEFKLMLHDFFTPQPVKGARAYYMRNIMHDWPDDKCRIILSHIVDAMDKTTSRVLIDDYVLPNTGAELRAASMDILMMLFVSGIERTLYQWETLLDSVGLEIVKVWTADTGFESVIEARAKA